MHSLVVAKTGRPVVAVEPLMTNIIRLHKSVLLNNLTSNYILVRNAISDIRAPVEVMVKPKNVGATSIFSIFKSTKGKKETISTILMDDLLDAITFKEAVMKIDIEGNEAKALVYAEKLFTHIKIHCIFMEWTFMKMLLVSHEYKETVLDLILFLTRHKFKPFASGHSLDEKDIEDWPKNIFWKYSG